MTLGFHPYIHEVNKSDATDGRTSQHSSANLDRLISHTFRFCYSFRTHKYIFQVHKNLLEIFHINSFT
jgi:hypothetical protein